MFVLGPSGSDFGVGFGLIGCDIWRHPPRVQHSHFEVSTYPQTAVPMLRWLPAYQSSTNEWGIGIPLWIPGLIAAGFTTWRFRADRIRSPHLCPNCAYDRRGLAPHSPCPECGAAALSG